MRRGKVHRLAQNQIFRRLDVRINRLVGLLGATGQPGQRHRRAHQLQEAAPRNRIDPLLRRRRKLALHRRLKLRAYRPARPATASTSCPSRPSASRRTCISVIGSLAASSCSRFTRIHGLSIACSIAVVLSSSRSSVAHLAAGQVLRGANLVVIHQEMAQLILAGELLVDRRRRRHRRSRNVARQALACPIAGSCSDAISGSRVRSDPSSCSSRSAPSARPSCRQSPRTTPACLRPALSHAML